MRVVVLVSGTGTLLQALLDATEDADYPVRLVAVGADRPGMEGLARAERANVPGSWSGSPTTPTGPPGTSR